MDFVWEQAERLIAALNGSEVKAAYLAAKERVFSDPVLRLALTDFKKADMAFRQKCEASGGGDFAEEIQMSKRYADMTLNGDIRAFFETEKALLALLLGLQALIAENSGMETFDEC